MSEIIAPGWQAQFSACQSDCCEHAIGSPVMRGLGTRFLNLQRAPDHSFLTGKNPSNTNYELGKVLLIKLL